MIQAVLIMIQGVLIMIQAVTVCVIRKNITAKPINKWLSDHKLKSISQTITSSAGTPPADVSESHPIGESRDTGRRRTGGSLPHRGRRRGRSARPAGPSITNPNQGLERSHLGSENSVQKEKTHLLHLNDLARRAAPRRAAQCPGILLSFLHVHNVA